MRNEVRNIPIIALTTDTSEKEKVKARESGMNDYVVKPYTRKNSAHFWNLFLKIQIYHIPHWNEGFYLSSQD